MRNLLLALKHHDMIWDDITTFPMSFFYSYSIFSFTYTNSGNFYANMEHLAVCFCVGVVTAKYLVTAREACLWHILQTVFSTLACCQADES